MPCSLLHVVEQADLDPYADPDLKDLVGRMPTFYCTNCNPLKHLMASEAARCLDRAAPCWKRTEKICE
ncbi:MAG: hypothetical protein FDZ70_06360 [Actinobacteria bacterium]|nr:MAG: hypothetical protein FDZ70_06360 [Actinomycetota bacterium]